MHHGTIAFTFGVVLGGVCLAAADGPASGQPAVESAGAMSFTQAMASAERASLFHPAEAPLEYRRAVELADTDAEKAGALLSLGRARLATANEADSAAIREDYERVLALPDISPAQRAEAWLGIAETRLAESRYAEVREACAQARAASDGSNWVAQARMLLARSSLQARDIPAARRDVADLLAMEDLEKGLKWEAEALRRAMELDGRVRLDHPRLFFNAETWPAVKERALTVEKARYDRMKARLDAVSLDAIRLGDWADYLMEAAFVYRVTEDPVALEKVRRMLRATADTVFPDRRSAVEYARPNILWLAALDWAWNDLVPSERDALAAGMLRYACKWAAAHKTGWISKRRNALILWPHYYVGSLFGYVGLALLDPQADDLAYARAMTMLGIGVKQHEEHFAYRAAQGGDDGVWQTNVDYDFGDVPVPAFAYFYAWQSATGSAIPLEWAAPVPAPHFVLRLVVGTEKQYYRHMNYAGHSNGNWGWGSNSSGDLYDHLGHFIHFFGRSDPRQAAIARLVRDRLAVGGVEPPDSFFPVFRFLMTDYEQAPPSGLPPGLPLARHFDRIGLVLMSSGFGPADTYALFAAGGGNPGNSDYDATHVSIYRQGYLAVDTGTRFAVPHSANYRHQTVAHNAVLIRMPGEQFPNSLTPVLSNAGGQSRMPSNARPLAFETGPFFAYAASDAAPVYHTNKCAQMTRQFLFMPPDHFVMFDRVTSKQADYPKTWLLHTANEPVIEGKEFRADQGEGRLFCRTLLPADAALEAIGGPGREFWADGRNWPITDAFQEPGAGSWWRRHGRRGPQPPEAMGRWRVEVKPGAARADDCFLHLIQVGGQGVEAMATSALRETGAQVELALEAGGRAYALRFNKAGAVGGHVRIEEHGKTVVDRALATDIQPQAGLALEP